MLWCDNYTVLCDNLYLECITFRYRDPSFNLASCVLSFVQVQQNISRKKSNSICVLFFSFFFGTIDIFEYIFLLLIASILFLLLPFFFSFFDNISYLPRHTNNAHFMLNSRRFSLCLHLNSSFYGVAAHFLFTVYFFLSFLLLEKTITNNKVIEFTEMSFDTIFHSIPFSMREISDAVSHFEHFLALSLSAIYLHAFIFMSFVSFILCHSSVFMFASLFVNTPPPTMVTNFGWVSSFQLKRCTFNAELIHCAGVLFDCNKIKIWNHLHKFFFTLIKKKLKNILDLFSTMYLCWLLSYYF